jgi:hypothetical protein
MDYFLKTRRKMGCFRGDLGFPFDRWKLPVHTERCHFGLAMSARQANRAHLLEVGLLRDFILADRK